MPSYKDNHVIVWWDSDAHAKETHNDQFFSFANSYKGE